MKINQNPNFGTHNTTARSGKIEYIVIHYVGATGTAQGNVNYFNQKKVTNASADFFVGHDGEIWQYNPDPKKRYCWSVGGSKYTGTGGSLYGKAKNANCVNIEMCVKDNGKQFIVTEATYNATIELTKHLMNLYNVPATKVIRHWDVNGKPCPSVKGWIPTSGNEDTWKKFKGAVSGSQVTSIPAQSTTPTPAKDSSFKVKVTASALNIRKGPGTNYPIVGCIKDKGIYTITKTSGSWGHLKSNVGWISISPSYTQKV